MLHFLLIAGFILFNYIYIRYGLMEWLYIVVFVTSLGLFFSEYYSPFIVCSIFLVYFLIGDSYAEKLDICEQIEYNYSINNMEEIKIQYNDYIENVISSNDIKFIHKILIIPVLNYFFKSKTRTLKRQIKRNQKRTKTNKLIDKLNNL